jgi:hypothetical protein
VASPGSVFSADVLAAMFEGDVDASAERPRPNGPSSRFVF